MEKRISSLENRGWLQNNVYTWKIGGFEERWRIAEVYSFDKIYSDPFYSGECGYKFRMWLYPGDRTRFLSLFITNIKGEYDAILQWPFPKRVTLTLIDQQENLGERQNVSQTITETWLTPMKGLGVDLGFSSFVSSEKLRTRSYIVNDTIFVQAEFSDAPKESVPPMFLSHKRRHQIGLEMPKYF